jgi:hypothetical protein
MVFIRLKSSIDHSDWKQVINEVDDIEYEGLITWFMRVYLSQLFFELIEHFFTASDDFNLGHVYSPFGLCGCLFDTTLSYPSPIVRDREMIGAGMGWTIYRIDSLPTHVYMQAVDFLVRHTYSPSQLSVWLCHVDEQTECLGLAHP